MRTPIYINENGLNQIIDKVILNLFEGVDWSYVKPHGREKGSANLSINTDMTDAGNKKGMMSVDTRIFGSKNDILKGDGTLLKNSLENDYTVSKSTIEAFRQFLNIINSNPNIDIQKALSTINNDNLTKTVNRWISDGYNNENIIRLTKRKIFDLEAILNPLSSTYSRVASSDDNEKIARYTTGTVPGTDIKFVSLFNFKDFNFNDAIKNGNVRLNAFLKKELGIEYYPSDKMNATYDDKIEPNIAQNFSLNNVGDGHFKQQYGLNRSAEKQQSPYTTVNQFIDKSIIYAAYALKKENFKPDFIVSVPSSSKFNEYYCTNLGRKINAEYIPDFFERDVLNVQCEEGYKEKMKQNGLTDEDIASLERGIKSAAEKEMIEMIFSPMKKFMDRNSKQLQAFKYISIDLIEDILRYWVFLICKKNNRNKDFSTVSIVSLLSIKGPTSGSRRDDWWWFPRIYKKIISSNMASDFMASLRECLKMVNKVVKVLNERGWRLGNYKTDKVKITYFPKRLRPYISHFYVVAGKFTWRRQLQKRFKNSNILIFDEDINSGISLKLVIDALKEVAPAMPSSQILCLSNAYSSGGQ